jgi:hypothetical protein
MSHRTIALYRYYYNVFGYNTMHFSTSGHDFKFFDSLRVD